MEPVQRNKTLERAKEAIAKQARSRLVARNLSNEVIIEGVNEGIRFSIAGSLLFDPGLAVIKPEGERALYAIAETLNDFKNLRVRIEGHTDSTPPVNSPYQNNWRLAQARAFSTLQFLRDHAQVEENRLSFVSRSDNRPRFPNDTVQNRALNRRVEIVLQGFTRTTSPVSSKVLTTQKFIPIWRILFLCESKDGKLHPSLLNHLDMLFVVLTY